MIRSCAWCGKVIELLLPVEDSRVTHGICNRCYDVYFPNLKPSPTTACLKTEPAARRLALRSEPEA